MGKYLVGIDAGHGMKTSGKRTPAMTSDLYIGSNLVRKKGDVIHEFEWNIAVSKVLAAALKRNGIDYIYLMDERGIVDTPLANRSKLANANKCDLVISNHYNAYYGCTSFLDKKGGLLVLRTLNCSSNSIRMGKLAVKHLSADVQYSYNYGLQIDKDFSGFTLAILRQTTMPAILIEYGFMDVFREARLMLDPEHQKKCGEAVAKAVCEYFGITYKAPSVPVSSSTTLTLVKNISTDPLNIRNSADWNAKPINVLKPGDSLTYVAGPITAANGSTKMYKCKNGNYITASTKYVKIINI